MTILQQIKQALSEMGFKAQPEIDSVRAELATAKAKWEASDATIATLNAEISSLKEQLQTAQDEVNAKGVEIKNLIQKAADAETKAKAAETKADEALAGMGVTVNHIPGPNTEAAAKPTSNSILSQYAAITDPSAKTKFFRANREALAAAWEKARANQ